MASAKRSLARTSGRGNSNRKRRSADADWDEQTEVGNEVVTPRRQTRGKKIDVISMLRGGDSDADDIEDSDEDPVWKPEEASPPLLCSRSQPERSKPKRHETRKTYVTYSSMAPRNNNRSVLLLNATVPCAIDQEYFKVGSFLILRSDFRANDAPFLWLIDCKCLLLRFDMQNDHGQVTYFPTKVYASSHSFRNFLLYLPVTVDRTSIDGGVTFNHKDVRPTNCEDIRQLAYQMLPLWSDFVIFLQIWTSHALDSTFLNEIRQESDEFFLAAMRTIYDQETVCRLNSVTALFHPKHVLAEVFHYPVLKLQKAKVANPKLACSSCMYPYSTGTVHVGGTFYNPEKKDLPDEDLNASLRETELTLCCACADIIVTLHTLRHIKYYVYQRCVQKVKQTKAGNQLLQDILLDDDWMKEMFHFLRLLWAECDFFCESRGAT